MRHKKDVNGKKMSETERITNQSANGRSDPSREFTQGYARGITDAISEIVKIQNPDVDVNALNEVMVQCTRDLEDCKKDLSTVLTENGFIPRKNTLVSASDIARYPNAVSGTATFLDRVARVDYAEGERFITFAGSFEHMVDVFYHDIKAHIKGGGHKVAALIVMTYITLRVLYKASMIREPMTIKASAALYDKAPGAVKRILTRIRGNNDRIMSITEDAGSTHQNLGSIVEMFKDISSETSL